MHTCIHKNSHTHTDACTNTYINAYAHTEEETSGTLEHTSTRKDHRLWGTQAASNFVYAIGDASINIHPINKRKCWHVRAPKTKKSKREPSTSTSKQKGQKKKEKKKRDPARSRVSWRSALHSARKTAACSWVWSASLAPTTLRSRKMLRSP